MRTVPVPVAMLPTRPLPKDPRTPQTAVTVTTAVTMPIPGAVPVPMAMLPEMALREGEWSHHHFTGGRFLVISFSLGARLPLQSQRLVGKLHAQPCTIPVGHNAGSFGSSRVLLSMTLQSRLRWSVSSSNGACKLAAVIAPQATWNSGRRWISTRLPLTMRLSTRCPAPVKSSWPAARRQD